MYLDQDLIQSADVTHSEIIEPLNLGSDELVTINGLVDLVEDIAGIKLKRHYNLSAPKGVNGRNSDNTLIREKLNWVPSIRLREGLALTYAWIENEMLASKQLVGAAK